MGAQGSSGAEGGEAAAAAAQGEVPAGAPAAASPSPPAEPAKPAEEKAHAPAKAPEPEPPKGAAEAEAKGGEEKSNTPKKEGKGKGKEGKEPKGKEGKAGKAAGKDGKEGKGKEGKEGKGKNAKGKEAKGKDVAKGKGKEKGSKGEITGSGPTAGGSGYRLNVKNLGKMITAEKLRELFEPFGAVSMAEIKKNDNGESRGFGFVVLPGEQEGKEAAKEMNGKEVEGTKLNVAAAERRTTEEDDAGKGKGKGKDKGKSPQELQSQYAQQWAAYSQMMYYQQYQQYAAMQQQNSFWTKSGPTASPQQEFEGSLKSISSRNGYGFIACKETCAMFPTGLDEEGNVKGRDVYVEESLLPQGAERGSRLVFTVAANAKGHPQAVTCRLASPI